MSIHPKSQRVTKVRTMILHGIVRLGHLLVMLRTENPRLVAWQYSLTAEEILSVGSQIYAIKTVSTPGIQKT